VIPAGALVAMSITTATIARSFILQLSAPKYLNVHDNDTGKNQPPFHAESRR